MYKSSLFSESTSRLVIFHLFDRNYSNRHEIIPIVGLICSYLMISDTEHFFHAYPLFVCLWELSV
jgi:hypothetical protein